MENLGPFNEVANINPKYKLVFFNNRNNNNNNHHIFAHSKVHTKLNTKL